MAFSQNPIRNLGKLPLIFVRLSQASNYFGNNVTVIVQHKTLIFIRDHDAQQLIMRLANVARHFLVLVRVALRLLTELSTSALVHTPNPLLQLV